MSDTVELFGIRIDRLTMQQAVERILGWVASGDRSCRYVVTPNVDHLVQLDRGGPIRAAYGDAALVVADSAPLVLASRLLGRALPERVAGSDLVPALFAAAERGDRPLAVFLLGAEPGVGRRAAHAIETKWRRVRVVGVHSPPFGFEHSAEACEEILQRVRSARPDLLVVGFGAPKQELWVQAHADRLSAPVALCVGATIDFLAGHKRRAPRWMQRAGLEWLHRVASEPRRLGRRYAVGALVFPRLLLSELRGRARIDRTDRGRAR